MSWTCSSCGETFKGPCFHACGIPKRAPEPSPLSPKRVKNPQGRVDVLLAQLLERGLQTVKNPAVPGIYQEVKPLVEQALKQHLGPRTKRGRKIAEQLFDLQAALLKVQKARGAA